MTTHCMVDLETLSHLPDAPIIQIAACTWNIDNKAFKAGSEFNVYVDPSTCEGSPSWSTMRWWMLQSDAAKQRVFSQSPAAYRPLMEALERLTDFVNANTPVYVWSHGATFDLPILALAYGKAGLEFPFPFRGQRDTRTLAHLFKDIKGIELPMRNSGLLHDALDDTLRQAQWVHEMWNGVRP